jgi:chromate transporter
MIAAAGIGVAEVAMFTADLYAQTGNLMDLCDIRKLIYCVIAFIAIRKIDVHPVVFIGISAVVGIVVGF